MKKRYYVGLVVLFLGAIPKHASPCISDFFEVADRDAMGAFSAKHPVHSRLCNFSEKPIKVEFEYVMRSASEQFFSTQKELLEIPSQKAVIVFPDRMSLVGYSLRRVMEKNTGTLYLYTQERHHQGRPLWHVNFTESKDGFQKTREVYSLGGQQKLLMLNLDGAQGGS